MKPEKPTPDFPLYAHRSGKWAKKIAGKTVYFGTWDKPWEALEAYRRSTEGPATCSITLAEACDRFLEAKEDSMRVGQLGKETFYGYLAACKKMVACLGRDVPLDSLTPDDFRRLRLYLSEGKSPVTLLNCINRLKVFINWSWESRLVAAPIHLGQEFRRPAMRDLRHAKRLGGRRVFSPEEIKALLYECGVQMRAMVLLGINAGMGNTDCAMLPKSAVDLEAGWIEYPRPKTGLDRAFPLWPETVLAMRQAAGGGIEEFFRRPNGKSWGGPDKLIAKHIHANLRRAGIGKGGFYWLRHTFRTVADEVKDQPAINYIMGHADHHISATYRESVSRQRLQAVVDHVRSWIGFPIADDR